MESMNWCMCMNPFMCMEYLQASNPCMCMNPCREDQGQESSASKSLVLVFANGIFLVSCHATYPRIFVQQDEFLENGRMPKSTSQVKLQHVYEMAVAASANNISALIHLCNCLFSYVCYV